MRRHRSARVRFGPGHRSLVAAVALGAFAAAALTTGATRAALTASTTTGASFAAGSVLVSDDDGGNAVIDVQGLLPGGTGQTCLTVTFTGSLPAMIPFYVSASSGSLAPYVTLAVLEGRGGGYGSCTGFVAERVAFSGTASALAAGFATAATGGGTFAPARSAQTRSYQVVYTLDADPPLAQQGQGLALTLRWESRQANVVTPLATGRNRYGQLGVGDTTDRSSFTALTGASTTWEQVSAGGEHSCGIAGDGSLWCWGYNGSGAVGDGTQTQRDAPVRIGTATDWRSVSVGSLNTCALTTAGALWCWGAGWGGVGDGTFSQQDAPVLVPGGWTWRSVSVGHSHTCAIRTDTTLWCWGPNDQGQLGDGTTTARNVPTQVGALTGWRQVSAGGWHTCALRTDHSLWCWGFNDGNGVGDGSGVDQLVPVRIGAGTRWGVVGTGSYFSCAIPLDGSLWCWGGWLMGQGATPAQVGAATTWAAVTGGDGHICGTRQDRTLWCWQDNTYGQLGTGGTDPEPAPVQVATGVAQVSAGRIAGDHTLALPWPTAS